MEKIIVAFVVMFFVSSCITNDKGKNVYLDINNKVLEQQIIEYEKYTESKNKNRSYILRIYCSEINDSTYRYIIEGIIDPELIKMMTYHFKCKIGEHEVFFTMLAGIVKKDLGRRNFFKIKTTAFVDFMQNYFPNDYKYYIENKGKEMQTIYEPEMCYLTFVQDKLVKKEMRKGMPW